MASQLAGLVGCAPSEVLVASTGVIGVNLKMDAVRAGIEQAFGSRSTGAAADAARAIMTTDTFPKLATRQAKIGERTVTINGFLKGSGMIAPDMATMLGFVFTDAKVPEDVNKRIGFSDEEKKRLIDLDYGYVAKNDAAFQDWWNKSFKA